MILATEFAGLCIVGAAILILALAILYGARMITAAIMAQSSFLGSTMREEARDLGAAIYHSNSRQ